MKGSVVAVSVLAALAIASCSRTQPTLAEPLGRPMFGEAPPAPEIDMVAAADGEILYRANCAVCHGAELEGAPDWKISDDEGRLPPPPMDSSGHTWHHSDRLLTDIIVNGSPDDNSAMRGFGGRLSSDDIAAILSFFKSTWGPDEREIQWTVTWQEANRTNP